MKYLLFTGVAVLVSLIFTSFSAEATTVTWPHSPNEEPNKSWKVSFNKPVDRATVNSNTVYITDSTDVKQPNVLTFSNGDQSIHIAPPIEGYRHAETYTLHITESVRNMDGKALKQSVSKTFTIKEQPTYDVVNVQQDGTTTLIAKYNTFEEASRRMQPNQAVLFQGKIIHMPAGLVATKSFGSSSLTILHSDKLLKKEVTYVPADTELVYVDSTDTYVEIELAGVNYFIKQENSRLLPSQTIKDRSYYYVRNGSLFHSIYGHTAATYGTYEMGVAPTFMQEGLKYFSTDGSHFSNEAGQAVGTAYQYFQYLPLRSETRYTAAELDAYILKRLQELEKANPNSPTYRNATTKSKLLGLGTELKRIEATSHVNAMHILALAQHESGYGLSDYAQKYNNLFGLYVRDDKPKIVHFETVGQNIEELLNAFLNKNYLPPNARYANGTNFGNKAVGVNVKYASDPYWGSKIAGHMYRMDRMMGGKELANQVKIGVTNTVNLKARRDPNTSRPWVYYYPHAGMPLIILDDQLAENPWMKVRSDSVPYEELYVHGDFVDKLEW
ncbi:glucosaminidase domain-containing protein [Sporosarcina sp. GW1-11]|uniref:N-acetylglucosaminidase n=1 Tax=Sporosarcina sp. GW1-11 TaxID=2899126 RepID=UPI00294F3561|nr:glucosaminidase domain-containing protein [Sporosarcina sp. GW1-11]MDV6378757.1 glucosaminidase domain-containing protein [Sporosarcina sp. GW1-11]